MKKRNILDNSKKSPEDQKKENNDNKNAVVPSVRQAVRRSNCPPSLVSSMDSGLGGQISPIIQDKGSIAQVGENGFVLKSDSIAPDQLAEIQRNIFESLKAKGIAQLCWLILTQMQLLHQGDDNHLQGRMLYICKWK